MTTRPQAPAAAEAQKRSLAAATAGGEPPAKRPKTAPAAPGDAPGAPSKSVPLTQEVAAKLTMLKGQGVKILAPAVRAIAAADRKDALVVLQVLAKKGAAVTDPTQWILNSLSKRIAGAGAAAAGPSPGKQAPAPGSQAPQPNLPKPPVAKGPIVKAPIAKVPAAGKAPIVKTPAPAGKAPIVKTPAATIVKTPAVGKAPIVKAPAPGGKAPIVKAPIGKTPPPGGKAAVVKAPAGKAVVAKARLPPKMREGLDFEQLALQSKVQTLNKQQIWQGPHPLDESAYAALLRIDALRGMEILEECEEKGTEGSLKDPSAFVRRAVAIEEATIH